MSFSSRVKEELSRQISPARHCRIAASSSGSSLRMTASPFLWEEVTFFTLHPLRIASFTWDSHIPQAMPSIFTLVSVIFSSSCLSHHNMQKSGKDVSSS